MKTKAFALILVLPFLTPTIHAEVPTPIEQHFYPKGKGMPADAIWKTKEGNLSITFREDGTIIKASNPTTIVKFNKKNVFIEGTYEDMTFTVINPDKMIFTCKEPKTKTNITINIVITEDHTTKSKIHYKGTLNGEVVDKTVEYDEKRIMVDKHITDNFNQVSEFSSTVRKLGRDYVYDEAGIDTDDSKN